MEQSTVDEKTVSTWTQVKGGVGMTLGFVVGVITALYFVLTRAPMTLIKGGYWGGVLARDVFTIGRAATLAKHNPKAAQQEAMVARIDALLAAVKKAQENANKPVDAAPWHAYIKGGASNRN